MTILNKQDCLLLIIDVQEKLTNAVFNKSTLLNKAEIISKTASILDIPVIITEQYPKGLGYTISSVKSAFNNKCKIFEKITFSALDNSLISESIEKLNKKQVILFGIETHICVNQTANALIQNGYDVTVIADACGSRDEIEHKFGLERIKEHGAHIITTETVVFEWLKSAKHPQFKEIQALIK
jgi:nicotinamidase-related amidase